jgi:ribosomal protein S5
LFVAVVVMKKNGKGRRGKRRRRRRRKRNGTIYHTVEGIEQSKQLCLRPGDHGWTW